MWDWLFKRRNKKQLPLDNQNEYYWLSQPYHSDLMLITVSSCYSSCIAYTEALVKINKIIMSDGEIINYMVYRDVETVSLRDWLLDENGYYCNDVSVNVEEWRETCNEFMVAYQSLRDHIDYKKQCESKLLVHLVNNITTLEKSFMDITVE